ncbi:DUF6227 family protein [Streptomyces sp. GC420]|uniref:DUF6227 family protein n=1 Tax=Streptomyces sp. GC420 TaxID=2697568 RepID=UPI0014150E1A|nr:DUF6227 family protein [Streptomyces sp. GC420]NBM18862.1 hypothetical protein [Streptomyces sp. GC420]
MSDPYDRETTETAEEQLRRVLGRALNSFELPDGLVVRLDSALAHATSLHSSHHSRVRTGAGTPGRISRETFRHSYLLSDGSSVVLWELVHTDGPGGRRQHELYAAEEEVRLAASRLRRTGGAGGAGDAGTPFADEQEADETGLELLGTLLASPATDTPRMYVPDNSSDHARRLLRRAENEDRPGDGIRLLLRNALAHQITQAFGRQCRIDGREAGFTLYEHGFLLLDGSEISLWEVEHTATPDGRHMCEVYESEDAAHRAMERRARVL